MNNELLENLKKDLELIIRDNFHPKHNDLMSICISEEVIELIKFVERVNKAFDVVIPHPSGNYEFGYRDGINQLAREIYEKK